MAYSSVKVEMRPIREILKRKGLEVGGAVQMFHTSNVLRRVQRYMPYRTGSTIKLMIAQTDIHKPEIILQAPYANYLYYGKAMAGPPPKYVTGKDLVYTKTKNPLAGPFWDKRLVAAEGKAMEQDLQRFIDRRAGK